MVSMTDPVVGIFEEIVKKHPMLQKSISEESIDEMYENAYHYYQNCGYIKAIRIFECLVFHRPYEPIFWEGLASSYFLQKEYDLSINAWAMVCLLDPKNAKAHLYAAEAYFSLGNRNEGIKALKAAKTIATDTHILNRIKLLTDIWEETNGTSSR